MIKRRASRARRIRNGLITAAVVGLVASVNASPVSSAARVVYRDYVTSRPDYLATHGRWQTISFPDHLKINAIHSVLLRTGKLLVIAGSGNDRDQFAAGTFTTMLYDPLKGTARMIPTPEDLFCGGHAELPDGNILVAGGTRKYEVLADQVTRAAGVMTVRNENPGDAPFTLPAGTRLVGPNGKAYETTSEVRVAPATRARHGKVTASSVQVWAQAVEDGKASVVDRGAQYEFTDLPGGRRTNNVYAVSDALTMDKQNYRGLDASYIFDVTKERYVPTGRLNYSRWYPTLTSIAGGDVLAVSGLDQFGNVLDGQNEEYVRSAGKWYDKPEYKRYFPTYPGLHRLADDTLFYSGTTSGYGSATAARDPGIWDLTDNTFRKVPGLRDPGLLEYGSSVLLPPAQDQKVAVIGGGGIGESDASTARIDVADLAAATPGSPPPRTCAHRGGTPTSSTCPTTRS